MAFLKLCGEIQLQGKTHIGLLITALRASLGLFSSLSYWDVHLQLSQTCFCSGGFWVLCVRACFKNIIWLKLTFFPCHYSYSSTILNQKMWGNVKIICVYVYACACVCGVYVGGGARVSFLPQFRVLGFVLSRQTLMALNSPAG